MHTESSLEIKLGFISGLKDVVLRELRQYPHPKLTDEGAEYIYLETPADFDVFTNLKSVSRVYLVHRNPSFNPLYISKHKGILGDIVKAILDLHNGKFATFKISCAGADSPEVKSIREYVQTTFKLEEKEEADAKIHIAKHGEIWEVGMQVTPRPLSMRPYKVRNMSGAMDPTIAYALNSLCDLQNTKTYLNAFSGSATLLIEAALAYPHLTQLVGFDNNKKNISLAIQNITEAGLIRKIQLKALDIFESPELGTFDVIVSDLPFGMTMLKDTDLETLYRTFISYCEKTLSLGGRLGIYTSQVELLEKILRQSKFKVSSSIHTTFTTSVDAYLKSKIFICTFKS
jgi:16S rRNA G966 N2-methylase RsmD